MVATRKSNVTRSGSKAKGGRRATFEDMDALLAQATARRKSTGSVAVPKSASKSASKAKVTIAASAKKKADARKAKGPSAKKTPARKPRGSSKSPGSAASSAKKTKAKKAADAKASASAKKDKRAEEAARAKKWADDRKAKKKAATPAEKPAANKSSAKKASASKKRTKEQAKGTSPKKAKSAKKSAPAPAPAAAVAPQPVPVYQQNLAQQRAADRATIQAWSAVAAQAQQQQSRTPVYTQQSPAAVYAQQQAAALPYGGYGWAGGYYRGRPSAGAPPPVASPQAYQSPPALPNVSSPAAAAKPMTPATTPSNPAEVERILRQVLGGKTPIGKHITRSGKILKMTPAAIRQREKTAHEKLSKPKTPVAKSSGAKAATSSTKASAVKKTSSAKKGSVASAQKGGVTTASIAAEAAAIAASTGTVRVKSEPGLAETKDFMSSSVFAVIMGLVACAVGYANFGKDMIAATGVEQNISNDKAFVAIFSGVALYSAHGADKIGETRAKMALPLILGCTFGLLCFLGGTAGVVGILSGGNAESADAGYGL
jgi:hypothetical protein